MDKIWIYLNDTQQGPYTPDQLRDLPIDADTPVWFMGLPKWTPAGRVPELAEILAIEPVAPESEGDEIVIRPVGTGAATAAATIDEPCPKTYIGWSIFVTVCCCSPFSVGALAASLFVTSLYNRGNLRGARRASDWAQWLIMISMSVGMFWNFCVSPLL